MCERARGRCVAWAAREGGARARGEERWTGTGPAERGGKEFPFFYLSFLFLFLFLLISFFF
jgi:hypothetical protein